MFEIHVWELRATFLRNHNIRRRKDPKRKTTQAEDNSSPEDSPSRRQLKLRKRPHPRQPPQLPEARGHCTRYVALHPLRGGAPEQKRCIAYGSGAAPQRTRTNAELAQRTTHRRTPPCATGPYWRQDGHAAHAAHAAHVAHAGTCTPPTPAPALRPTATPALRPTATPALRPTPTPPTPPTPLHAKSQ